jgi:hypothetical protein
VTTFHTQKKPNTQKMGSCGSRSKPSATEIVLPSTWSSFHFSSSNLCNGKIGCPLHRSWDDDKHQDRKYGFQQLSAACLEKTEMEARQKLCWLLNHPYLYAIMLSHKYRVEELDEVPRGDERFMSGRNVARACRSLTSNLVHSGESTLLLVALRYPSGSWYTEATVISIMIHELAHSDYLGHGSNFHDVERSLRKEYATLDPAILWDEPVRTDRACCCAGDI